MASVSVIVYLGARKLPVDLGPFETSKSEPGIRIHPWLNPKDASTVHSIKGEAATERSHD